MKQLKFKIISICIGLLISLFLGELIARVYFFGSAAFSYSKVNSFGILDNSGILQYAENKDLKYELIPNLDTKYKLVNFRTNKEGFRDRNHTKNDTNVRKIAILGDSFTMGTGISEDAMYVQKTEEILNKNQEKYEFFNFGSSGYSLVDYFKVLERNALKHNPDLVIIGFCATNDHLEVGKEYTLDNFTIKPKKNVFWDSYLRKLLSIKLNARKFEALKYEKRHLTYVKNQFEEFQQVLTEKNIKGLIFYLDLNYDSVRVEQIKQLAAETGFLFLDTSIAFKNKNLFNYIINELDTHPNNKANLIFAARLKDFILQNEQTLFNN